MACTIYRTNKKTGVVYAYLSESYRDPVTKKPKSKRTYLGRVDPNTNMIIPKAEGGSRNTTPVEESSGELIPSGAKNDELEKVIIRQSEMIKELQESLKKASERAKELEDFFNQIKVLSDKYSPHHG